MLATAPYQTIRQRKGIGGVCRGKIRGVQQNVNARSPFSFDDLRVMFEGEKRIDLLTTQLSRPSRAWGFLIALYTGARAEEIYSLSIVLLT